MDLIKKVKEIDKYIFILGVALIPFDNLAIAPSRGWATVAPIVLSIYSMINFRIILEFLRRKKEYVYLIIFVIITTLLNYFVLQFKLKLFVGAGISIFLGIFTSCSIFIFNEKKDLIKYKNLLVNLLLIGYSVSLVSGILQFMSIKFDVSIINKFFNIFLKRTEYINSGRVSYLFTEPSFIGMHIYGVLLPIYYATKNKKILNIIILFSVSVFTFDPGVKSFLDIIVILIIIGSIKLANLSNKGLKRKLIIGLVSFLTITSIGLYSFNPRVKGIFENGINGDASLAVRYLRINASIKGYQKRPFNFLVGYGIGNARYPLNDGYHEAREEYSNPWTVEADAQYMLEDDGGILIIYIRLISEFGLLVFGFLIYKLISAFLKSSFGYKNEIMLINLYLYIQFEAYAFYSLGLLLFFLIHNGGTYARKEQ